MRENSENENKAIILNYLLEQDALEDRVLGIAKLAIDRGYSSLSDKQKWVLKECFEPSCEGCKFHDCHKTVSDESYVFSIEHQYDLERITCRDCAEMIFDQNRTWDRMRSE